MYVKINGNNNKFEGAKKKMKPLNLFDTKESKKILHL